MERKAVVCLAGTLDTKGTEYAYVKDCLVASGRRRPRRRLRRAR